MQNETFCGFSNTSFNESRNFFEKSDTLIVLTLRASYWGTKQVVCCFCRASWAKLSSSSFNLFTLLLLASGPGPIQPPSLPTCCLPKRFLSTGYPLSTSTYSSSVISPNAALTAEQWTNIQRNWNLSLFSDQFLQLWHDKTVFHIVLKSCKNVSFLNKKNLSVFVLLRKSATWLHKRHLTIFCFVLSEMYFEDVSSGESK